MLGYCKVREQIFFFNSVFWSFTMSSWLYVIWNSYYDLEGCAYFLRFCCSWCLVAILTAKVKSIGEDIYTGWWKAVEGARGWYYCLSNAQTPFFLIVEIKVFWSVREEILKKNLECVSELFCQKVEMFWALEWKLLSQCGYLRACRKLQ